MNGAFEGIGGAVSLSLIAFSIVFLVLMGLTAIIYGIRLLAGSKPKVSQAGGNMAAKPSVNQQAVPTVAVTPSGISHYSGISEETVAAITGALIAKVGGGFRIVDIKSETASPVSINGWVSWGRFDVMQGMDRSPWNIGGQR